MTTRYEVHDVYATSCAYCKLCGVLAVDTDVDEAVEDHKAKHSTEYHTCRWDEHLGVWLWREDCNRCKAGDPP